MKPIVEMFEGVVAKVQAKQLAYLQTVNSRIQQVHCAYGSELEIINTLVNMNSPQSQQFLKYPLIALIQDFNEEKGRDFTTGGSFRPKKILICNQTPLDSKSKGRYEINFKPILQPLYLELLRQFVAHPGFITRSVWSISHTKIDHPFFGKEGLYGNIKNEGTDCLDCIEIRNLELPLRKQYCETTPTKNF